MLSDLRYALRSLRRTPGFTAVALLTLALGIGANSAIFSVLDAVLLRPLPYRSPEELVMVYGRYPATGRTSTSLPDFLDWKAGAHSLRELAGFDVTQLSLTGVGEPERIPAEVVTSNFFRTLGATTALGRTFTEREETAGQQRVVILSHDLWTRRFGASRAVIGSSVKLSGTDYTIVGVAQPGFRFLEDVQVYLPLRTDTALDRRSEFLGLVGRMAPGATVATVQRDLDAVERRLATQYPTTNATIRVEVASLREDVVGSVRPALLVFMGAVALVLLIACANVANLLLARAAAREREMAVRAALGARRMRIVRQLLAESLLLAVGGAMLGLLVAAWGVSALRATNADALPRLAEVRLGTSVLAFTLGLSIVTGLLFGLAPALRLTTDLQSALRQGGRGGTSGASARRTRSTLVFAEVALALVLLAGAGVLVRSFVALQRVDPGFDARNVLTFRLSLPRATYGELERAPAAYDDLLARLSALPGVRHAAITTTAPMEDPPLYAFSIEGRPDATVNADAQPFIVGGDYFRAMGVRILRGRAIGPQDDARATGAVVVNEEMVRRFWPGRDPIGARITFGDPLDSTTFWQTVVGVAADVRQQALTATPYPQVYGSFAQGPRRAVVIVLRTAGDPAAMLPAARRVVHAFDPMLPLGQPATMQDRIAATTARPRVNVLLLGVFATVALCLAAVGIYGVMSYGVAQRTREIGIRMALGADAGSVLRLVVGQGMLPVGIGVAVGLVAALAASRVLRGLVYGVSAADPVSLVAVAAFLGTVGLVASWLPARRAARVAPSVALREE